MHGPPNNKKTGIIAAAMTLGHKMSAPTCKSVDDTAAAHEHGQAGSVAGFTIIDQVQAGANTQ